MPRTSIKESTRTTKGTTVRVPNQRSGFKHLPKESNLRVGITPDDNYPVEIDVEVKKGERKHARTIDLEPIDDYYVFSMSGSTQHTAGQMIDDLVREYDRNDPGRIEIYPKMRQDVETLHRIWKRWHLNDLHAGTRVQEKALEDAGIKGKDYTYDKAVEHLKSVGLYEDRGYKYGSAWLVEPLPTDVINEVKHALVGIMVEQ